MSSLSSSSLAEEQFLQHLEKLSVAQHEAEKDRAKLTASLAAAKARLCAAESERDEAGRVGAAAAAERFQLQSTQFAQSRARRVLESRLAAVLAEYCALHPSSASSSSSSSSSFAGELTEELRDTQRRLEEGAAWFDAQGGGQQQQQQPSVASVVVALQFELDRAKRRVHTLQGELQATTGRLSVVQQHEATLMSKVGGGGGGVKY